MADLPDFIVDPSGNVEDVRHRKYARPSRSAAWQNPATDSSAHTERTRTFPPPSTKTTVTPEGVVAIGCLIAIVIAYVGRAGLSAVANSRSAANVPEVDSGNRAFARGDYDMALLYFNMAIRSNPNLGEAYNGRGLVYDAQGEYDKAITEFNRAIELLPDWAAGYNNRGASYFAQGLYDQALADFDKAIQLKPKLAKAYYNRGLVHNAQGDYDAAIADFDQAIQLTPEEYYASFNKLDHLTPGPMAEQLESMSNYSELIQYTANLPLAHANRGLAYFYKGEFAQSAADLEKALNLGLDPTEQPWVEMLLEQARDQK